MKAKEYVAKFQQDSELEGVEKAANKLGLAFLLELKEIKKKRNAKYDWSIPAILNEQEQKWLAVCRLIPELRQDGFANIVFDTFPLLRAVWNSKVKIKESDQEGK